MPIKRRASGDDEGGSNVPLIRRPKKLIKSTASGPHPVGAKTKVLKKKIAMPPELAEVVGLWNAQAPGTMRALRDSHSFGRYSTGILSVDLCLVGGFMRSRAAMVYGERSAGKTTICSKAMATALRMNPDDYAVFVDLEGTADKTWMTTLGCDPDRIIIVEPSTGEDAVDQVDALVRTEGVCFVGLDSVAMLTPFKELDSSAEDNQIGLQARLIGKMLRRLNNALLQERRRNHYPALVLLNQFRMKAGLVFGDPRTLPGGKALEFVTSQQIEASNKEHKDEKSGIVKFNEHSFKVTKDKTGGRFKEGKFKLIRDESAGLGPVGYIDQAKSILEYGARAGLVEGKYRVDGSNHRFASEADFRTFLIENPEFEYEICAKIVNHYRSKWGIDE